MNTVVLVKSRLIWFTNADNYYVEFQWFFSSAIKSYYFLLSLSLEVTLLTKRVILATSIYFYSSSHLSLASILSAISITCNFSWACSSCLFFSSLRSTPLETASIRLFVVESIVMFGSWNSWTALISRLSFLSPKLRGGRLIRSRCTSWLVLY